MSFGFHEGYSDTDDIHFCPYCGGEIGSWHADGTGKCTACGARFAVIGMDDETEE